MKIRDFIRLRKQNDMVKVSLLFFLTGLGFFLSMVGNGIGFIQSTNERTEYILRKSEEITKDDMSKLSDVEYVSSASRTLEENIIVKYSNRISGINCRVATKDYLEDLLGVDCSSNTKTFYITPSAFDMLNQELYLYETYGVYDEDGMYTVEEGTVMSLRYRTDESGNAAYKRADFVLVKDTIYGDKPVVWTYTDDVNLARKADLISILLDSKPIESTFRIQMEQMGFSFENTEELVQWEAEIEIRMLKIEYGVLIALICLVAGGVIFHKSYTRNS